MSCTEGSRGTNARKKNHHTNREGENDPLTLVEHSGEVKETRTEIDRGREYTERHTNNHNQMLGIEESGCSVQNT